MPRFKTQKKGKTAKKTTSGGSNRGRKRLPTNLHILNGNPSNLNLEERLKNEPKFTDIAPDCPEWLDEYGKAEWNRLAPELERLGLLTQADLAAFAAYCQAYSDVIKATEQLKELGPDGWVQTTESGYKQQHPLVGIKNTAMDKMKSFLIEFGFTPASRSKVTANEPPKSKGISALLSG